MSIAEELTRLNELYEAGDIPEAEFSAAKGKLLGTATDASSPTPEESEAPTVLRSSGPVTVSTQPKAAALSRDNPTLRKGGVLLQLLGFTCAAVPFVIKDDSAMTKEPQFLFEEYQVPGLVLGLILAIAGGITKHAGRARTPKKPFLSTWTGKVTLTAFIIFVTAILLSSEASPLWPLLHMLF